MKKLLGTGIAAALVVVLASGWAYAGKILFPYINSNPGNLSTIINVINTTSTGEYCGDPDGPPLMLHYRYMTKLITASNMDYCDESDFCRPTTKNDIVTFDVAGHIGSGQAMFNDDTSYDAGFGAPNFDLPTVIGEVCGVRGYLLVSHTCGDECYGEGCRHQGYLDGEAMLLDVVNGAAWGYRAAQSYLDENEESDCFGFAGITDRCNPVPNATTDLMVENEECAGEEQAVALYPPNEFCTRFFVTPLVIAYKIDLATNFDCPDPGHWYGDCCVNNDMSIDEPKKWQKRTTMRLVTDGDQHGVFNRNEQPVSKGTDVEVRCVGAINLGDLIGSIVDAPDFQTQGGWANLDLVDPIGTDICKYADHAAIVTKLQFGAPSFAAGSMINTADTIRSLRVMYGDNGPDVPCAPCVE